MAITNGLTVTTYPLPAKAIAEIRKVTGLSITEIRTLAENGDHLIEKDLSDDEGLKSIIELTETLSMLNIKVELYQGGFKRPVEFMKNVYESHRETAKDVGLEN